MAVYEKHNNVNVWWLPKEFCQSRFGEFRESGTNSCTLISLLVADKISKELTLQEFAQTLPPRAIEIFGDAMNDGNSVYSRIFKRYSNENSKLRSNPNLNIPEAITALAAQSSLRFSLHEWFYTHVTASPSKETYRQSVASRISQVLKLGEHLFKQSRNNSGSRNLFAALIADSRTTILIFEFPNNVVSFFDSHQHGRKAGAVVAQCSIDHSEDMCHWFVSMLQEIYNSRPSVYEISFLTTAADASNILAPN